MLTSLISTPERWLVEWFGGGGHSKTGVHVNEETALQIHGKRSSFTLGLGLDG